MQEKVLVLTDNKIGANNQSIALAELVFEKDSIKKINVEYNFFAKLPNFLNWIKLGIVNLSEIMLGEKPDIVISCGRRLAKLSVFIQKNSNPNAKLIQITNPELDSKKFDILIIPEHDNQIYEGKNIIKINGSINNIKTKICDISIDRTLSHPVVAILIGGTSKNGKMTNEMGYELVEFINKATGSGTALVATSRRTPNSVTNIIKQNIKCQNRFFDWEKNSKSMPNPYLSFLKNADFIITTGESIAICSEAFDTGKPVYIYAPKDLVNNKKYQKFHPILYKNGRVFALNKNTDFSNIQQEPSDSITESEKLAKIVKSLLS